MPFQIPKRYSTIIINPLNKNTVNVFWQIFYFYYLPRTNPPPPHHYYHHQDGREDLAQILLRCMPAMRIRVVSLVIELQGRCDMSTIDYSILGTRQSSHVFGPV